MSMVSREIVAISAEVSKEVSRAMSIHGPMHGPHEGYAVILEEVDELWDEVKAYPKRSTFEAMRKEAIQIAAMAVRFIIDVCPTETEAKP